MVLFTTLHFESLMCLGSVLSHAGNCFSMMFLAVCLCVWFVAVRFYLYFQAGFTEFKSVLWTFFYV